MSRYMRGRQTTLEGPTSIPQAGCGTSIVFLSGDEQTTSRISTGSTSKGRPKLGWKVTVIERQGGPTLLARRD